LPKNYDNNDKLDKKNIAVLSVNYCNDFRGKTLEEIRLLDYKAIKSGVIPDDMRVIV